MKSFSATNFRTNVRGIRRLEATWIKLCASIVFASLFSVPAWAASQTVTLSVPGMTCAACPITVKVALARVEGVTHTEVSFERREAVVTFEDAETSVDKLTQATADAGYPSELNK